MERSIRTFSKRNQLKLKKPMQMESYMENSRVFLKMGVQKLISSTRKERNMEKNTSIQFTGLIRSDYTFFEGVFTGFGLAFCENGKVRLISPYPNNNNLVHGKEHGFYESGKLKFTTLS